MKRWLLLLACCWAVGLAQAQFLADTEWKEDPAPPPPSFSLDRLLRFEVDPNSSLVYAIDPQTLSISPGDRVVRYVMVATSPSGVRNVFYEGIRCGTAQVKTYARHADGRWIVAVDPPWHDMMGRPSRHALRLAWQGACDNSVAPLRVEDIVRALRSGPAVTTR
jgi:hypothetical protein